jgi:hypothetical protein
MNKQELLEALEDSYDTQQELYDSNLERMGKLHEQIEAIKESNQNILNRMKETGEKIRRLKDGN